MIQISTEPVHDSPTPTNDRILRDILNQSSTSYDAFEQLWAQASTLIRVAWRLHSSHLPASTNPQYLIQISISNEKDGIEFINRFLKQYGMSLSTDAYKAKETL
jgi:hypothetical protein